MCTITSIRAELPASNWPVSQDSMLLSGPESWGWHWYTCSSSPASGYWGGHLLSHPLSKSSPGSPRWWLSSGPRLVPMEKKCSKITLFFFFLINKIVFFLNCFSEVLWFSFLKRFHILTVFRNHSSFWFLLQRWPNSWERTNHSR